MNRNWEPMWDGLCDCVACKSTIINVEEHKKVCEGEEVSQELTPILEE